MALEPISFVCNVQASIKAFGGGTSTSSTNTDPWSGQQPYLTSLFQQAQNQYQNYTPQYYGYTDVNGTPTNTTGASTVAGFNPIEDASIAGIANTGLNGTSALNNANTSVANILSGDPAMNQSIMAGVLPTLQSQFTQGNSVNNPAMAYASTNGVANALLQNQLAAANSAQGLYNTTLQGQEAGLGAGQAAQTQAQNELTNNVNAWNYYQQLPYSQINQMANLINGQYGSTSTTSTPQQSLFGSLFSDRRLKENIVPVGKANNGLTIYAYNYKDDRAKTVHLGMLADEVQAVNPDAVTKHASGYLMVNYQKAVE